MDSLPMWFTTGVSFIQETGFPIFVALYFLLRYEKILRKLLPLMERMAVLIETWNHEIRKALIEEARKEARAIVKEGRE